MPCQALWIQGLGFQKVIELCRCFTHQWINPLVNPQLNVLLGSEARQKNQVTGMWPEGFSTILCCHRASRLWTENMSQHKPSINCSCLILRPSDEKATMTGGEIGLIPRVFGDCRDPEMAQKPCCHWPGSVSFLWGHSCTQVWEHRWHGEAISLLFTPLCSPKTEIIKGGRNETRNMVILKITLFKKN